MEMGWGAAIPPVVLDELGQGHLALLLYTGVVSVRVQHDEGEGQDLHNVRGGRPEGAGVVHASRRLVRGPLWPRGLVVLIVRLGERTRDAVDLLGLPRQEEARVGEQEPQGGVEGHTGKVQT
jgi:hypothetical protein